MAVPGYDTAVGVGWGTLWATRKVGGTVELWRVPLVGTAPDRMVPFPGMKVDTLTTERTEDMAVIGTSSWRTIVYRSADEAAGTLTYRDENDTVRKVILPDARRLVSAHGQWMGAVVDSRAGSTAARIVNLPANRSWALPDPALPAGMKVTSRQVTGGPFVHADEIAWSVRTDGTANGRDLTVNSVYVGRTNAKLGVKDVWTAATTYDPARAAVWDPVVYGMYGADLVWSPTGITGSKYGPCWEGHLSSRTDLTVTTRWLHRAYDAYEYEATFGWGVWAQTLVDRNGNAEVTIREIGADKDRDTVRRVVGDKPVLGMTAAGRYAIAYWDADGVKLVGIGGRNAGAVRG